MKTQTLRLFASRTLYLVLALSLAGMEAHAQCTPLVSGLLEPFGIALSNQGNLLVSETGTTSLDSCRISVVEPNGQRRTLLAGLPSALNLFLFRVRWATSTTPYLNNR